MKLITITGPSGIGKGFLKDSIKEYFNGQIAEMPWFTTRQLRADEKHRNDRVYLPRVKFHHKNFLIIDEVAGNLYGLPKYFLPNSSIAITEIRCHLIKDLIWENQINIALVSSEEFLKNRLIHRGTETKKQVRLRLAEASNELREICKHREFFSLFCEITQSNESSLTLKINSFLERHFQEEKNEQAR